MNIAVVFFGLSRTYQQTAKFIDIHNYFNVDFYGHSWADNDREREQLQERLIKTYTGSFKVTNYKKHFQRLSSLIKAPRTIKNNISDVVNLNQWRSLELAVRLIPEKNNYDIVIATRYDVISEVLYDTEKTREFINFLKTNSGIINNSFTNLGKNNFPMLDDFIFIGDNYSIKKFAKGLTKKNIYRLYLNNNLIKIKNPLEKIIIDRLNTDQNQYRVIWFEKAIYDNINLYHKKNITLIYKPGCTVKFNKKPLTNEQIIEIYEYYKSWKK